MLVTFKSKHHGDIMMFGNVAVDLIKLMGHSGQVPGALAADEVPGALLQLQQALSSRPDDNDTEDDEEAERPVSLATRAAPLIEMLNAAERAGGFVMWE